MKHEHALQETRSFLRSVNHPSSPSPFSKRTKLHVEIGRTKQKTSSFIYV